MILLDKEPFFLLNSYPIGKSYISKKKALLMFALSTKSDYGLLLLTLLAKEKKRGFVALSEIASESGLPHAFVSRIASQLSKGGILKSKEGVAGGYKLVKDPKNISIAQTIEILDGPWAPTKCTLDLKLCSYEKLCPMADNWRAHLKRKMWNILKSYTLKDLIKS